MKRLFAVFFFIVACTAHAHVGSPNVFFDGKVGEYPVHIVVRPPNVIPGVAEIAIHIDGDGVQHVRTLPVYGSAELKGAPPPDEAKLVHGETNLYTSTLWLMKSGGYSVNVSVEGAHGQGTVVVPVNAIATNTNGMPKPFAAMLIVMATLLFLGIIRIAGSVFGESLVAPGETITPARIRRGRIAMLLTLFVVAFVIWGGRKWWNLSEKEYRDRNLYRPSAFLTTVAQRTNQNVLALEINDTSDRVQNPRLIPDHGKLMHLFLIREPDSGVFAHLHPVKKTWDKFEVALPPLPAGHYQLYGDITHESGFSETLTADTDIPAPSKNILQYWPSNSTDQICGTGFIRTAPPEGFSLPPDPDDSWHIETSSKSPQTNNIVRVSNNRSIIWQRSGDLIENRELALRFQLLDTNGQPENLEPYIGMYGHAAVRRNDGQVFAHIHPAGTFSMAAQEYFSRDLGGQKINSSATTLTNAPHPIANSLNPVHEVSFPYAFPSPGAYHIWVQLKSGGQAYTGMFEAVVKTSN